MVTFLRCGTIGTSVRLDGKLRVVHVSGTTKQSGASLVDAIAPLVAKAVTSRTARREELAGNIVARLLGGPAPDSHTNIPASDMKWLIREIVAEAVLVECGFGEPFYSKWRHAGTSTSSGIDIILRKGNSISANESKHLHTLRRGNSASQDASLLIVSAFRQSTDSRTKIRLRWLYRQIVSAERLGSSMHTAQTDVNIPPHAAKIISSALRKWNVFVNAAVVFDARHGASAEAIGQRLNHGTLRGIANPAAAVVICIEGLHEATARMIGRYC